MGIALRHLFVCPEQMTAARAEERRAEVRGGGWGGGAFTYSFAPIQDLLYTLKMTRIMGLFNLLKKGKVDCGRLERGGRYLLLNNFLAHPDVVSVSHYCSPYSVSRGGCWAPTKIVIRGRGVGQWCF